MFDFNREKANDLEHRIFIFICSAGFFTASIITILDVLIYHPTYKSYLTEAFAMTGFLVFWYFSDRTELFPKMIRPMCIFIMFVGDLGWVTGGGSHSLANMWTFSIVICASISILPATSWKYYLVIAFINLTAITFVEYFYGKQLFPHVNSVPSEVFLGNLSFFIIMVTQVCLVMFLKSRYDQDRNTLKVSLEMLEASKNEVEAQNEELTQQNEENNTQKEIIEEYNSKLIQQAEELNDAFAKITYYNQNLSKLVDERTSEIMSLNKEFDLLFYRSSHDFRGPLMSLQGLVALANIPGQDSHLLWKKVDIIVDNLDRMIHKFVMISEINQFNSLDHYETIDIYDSVNDVLVKYAGDLSTFNVNTDFSIGNYLVDDPKNKLLKIIFSNIIENAIDYRRINGPNVLSIKLHEVDGFLEITVLDNGFGIDETVLNKVTDMYYRGSKISKGHGLGLYVVSSAVKKLRGTLNIESAINKVTLVKIGIPIR